jgi:hypothetical protein
MGLTASCRRPASGASLRATRRAGQIEPAQYPSWASCSELVSVEQVLVLSQFPLSHSPSMPQLVPAGCLATQERLVPSQKLVLSQAACAQELPAETVSAQVPGSPFDCMEVAVKQLPEAHVIPELQGAPAGVKATQALVVGSLVWSQ